jgi:sensor histidine kinase YesM
MESMRFEGKFDFEIKINPEVNKYFEIPTMILQPFVENAINHGLRYKKTKGKLTIQFTNEKNNLVCKIVDNGVGRKLAKEIQSKSKKGYMSQGLKITEERLNTYNKINDSNIEFLISDHIRNSTDSTQDIGTEVVVRFPNNW